MKTYLRVFWAVCGYMFWRAYGRATILMYAFNYIVLWAMGTWSLLITIPMDTLVCVAIQQERRRKEDEQWWDRI